MRAHAQTNDLEAALRSAYETFHAVVQRGCWFNHTGLRIEQSSFSECWLPISNPYCRDNDAISQQQQQQQQVRCIVASMLSIHH